MSPFTHRDLRLLGFGVVLGFVSCFVGYSIPASYMAQRVVRQNMEIRDLNDTLDRELPWYKRLPDKIARGNSR